MTGAHTLVLVRHGQSEGNREDVFTGWLDVPLTGQGRSEAGSAGRKLRSLGLTFEAAYCSELSRAVESCRIILDELELDDVVPVHSPAFNERDYGELTGMNKQEARRIWGASRVLQWRRSYPIAPPGGESLRETAARVLAYFVHDILPGVLDGRSSLIVAHGNSLRALVMALDGLDAQAVETTEIATGEIIVYRLGTNAKVASKEIFHV